MNPTTIVEMRSVIEHVVTVQESFREVLTGLTRLATGNDESLNRLCDSMERVMACQQATEERLNALIAVVDDLVRNQRATLPSE